MKALSDGARAHLSAAKVQCQEDVPTLLVGQRRESQFDLEEAIVCGEPKLWSGQA